MNKKTFFIAMLFIALFGVTAHAKSIPSKALTSARIYINPGHGCYCSECRGMGTVKHGATNSADTSGFYESNTNLWKAFGMRDKLIEYGVPYNKNLAPNSLSQPNLVMSRIRCGGVHNGLYDRALSEIAAECESWNADVMISIHSNATAEGSTTNYPLLLYRGYTGSNQNGGSQAIASKCWGYLWENTHMMWTYYSATNMNIQGDWTFMSSWGTQGYGVLRHSVPGFLAEGYFHTYQPARHRAMNRDAGRIEGFAYAKGFRDYFGGGKAVSTGDIYGVLRDAERTFTHTYYNGNKNTDDKYLPINNATITLKNSEGTTVQTYKTDDEYNGVFVFKGVAPGTYSIVCSHPDYADVTTSVTVQADKVVYPSVKISEGEQIPVQGHYAYDLSMTQNGDDYTLKFKSTGDVESGSIILTNTATATKQVIKIDEVKKGENSISLNANDIGENSTFTWAVSLTNLKSSGIQLIKEDNSIIYNHNSGNMARIGLAIDKDPESTNFGKIYTLTSFSQGLQTFNQDLSKNGSKVKIGTFGQDTDGSTSSYKNIRSNRITINSGKVYIANYANQNYGVWVHTPGTTTSSQIIGTNYDRAVGFKGTGSSRQMYVMHEKTNSSNLGLRYYNIGTSDTWTAGSNSPSGSLTSTVLANGDGDIIVTSKGVFASQWRAGTNTADAPAFVFYNNSNSITFNSSTIGSLSGTHKGGIAITNDLSTFAIVEAPVNTGDDVEVEIYNVSWNGETPSFSFAYTIPLSGTKQVDQMAFDQANNLYIASQQKGLLVYTIKMPTRETVTPAKASMVIQGKALPAVQGHYAYDLKMSQSGDEYTLAFKSTGDVENASVLFINKADSDTLTLEIGKVTKGENTVTINAVDFGKNADYAWAVAFDNPASPSNELVYEDKSITYTHSSGNMARIGMAINRDTEADKFGRIFTITAFGQGIQEFDQVYNKIGSPALTGQFGIDADDSSSSNKYYRSNRLAISDNKVYIANYAALKPGVHIYNSHNGGSATILNGMYERAVAFSGSGADRKMFVFNDVSLRRYDIGASDSWTANTNNPSFTYEAGMINGDGDILVTGNGVIVSQHRYRGNNTSDVPVFKFVDFDGNVVFNSSILTELTGTERGAMSISSDLSTFAIVDGYAEGAAADIEVDIFDVTWAGSTPSFSYRTSIPLIGTKQVDQMTFDYAGNLMLASQQRGLLVYAVKNPARTTVTPAKSTKVITGKYVPGTEGHFAYDLQMEETSDGYTLTFKSTGDVDNAKIVFTEVDNTKAVNTSEQVIGAVTKGEQSVELLKESLPFGTQTWAVVLENAASEGSEVVKSDASVAHDNNKAQGGVAVDKDTESANFGKIYTVTAYAQGLQAFDAEMNPVGERLFKGTPFVDSWYSPYRVKANSGKLYMNDWIDSNSGVYVYDPNAETVSAPNMFVGTRPEGGAGIMVNDNAETVTCNVSSVAFVGEGEGRKMYAFAEDKVNDAPASSLLRYDIGTSDTWATAPSAVFSSMSSLLSTTDVELVATENGLFCAQVSGSENTAEKPAFVYVDFGGNVLFNSSTLTDLNGCSGGAIAYNGNSLAIVDAEGDINVYKVTWNNNVPAFSDKFTIKLWNTGTITQMDYDIAGNLYAFSVQEGLLKIAVKNDARETRTDAKASQQLVNSILTAIENVEEDNAPVEYFNLQGVKVANPSNGIFIKKQGSKATKSVFN